MPSPLKKGLQKTPKHRLSPQDKDIQKRTKIGSKSDSDSEENQPEISLESLNKTMQMILCSVKKTEERMGAFEATAQVVKKLEGEVPVIKSQIHKFEKGERNHNLVIFGIKDSADETRRDLFAEVSRQLLFHFKVEGSEIDNVHRIGKFSKGKVRPTLVSLVREHTRWEILSARKSLGTALGSLIIKPDQSPEERREFGILKTHFLRAFHQVDPSFKMAVRNGQLFVIKGKSTVAKFKIADGEVTEIKDSNSESN
jgi:hypothetical protein